MRNLKTAAAAAICAGIGLFAISATAANAATVADCLHSARQVREAISNNQNSAKLDDAQRQQRYGREFCNTGFYDKGTAHYAEALRILGDDSMSVSQR